jgi:ABC-type transport system involved in multi-copper enzyme maturation permease subunit
MIHAVRTIATYTLLEALRNRLMWLQAAVVVIGLGLSGFLAEVAITESRQIQVALLAAFLRYSAVFLLATFVVTSIVREANDKGLEGVLALPIPRAAYALGKLAGFCALALVPALSAGVLMAWLAPADQALVWTLSLAVELWVVAAFSLLCVFTLHQIMAALSAVMAFYLLARSVTALQLIGHGPYSRDTPSQVVLNAMLDGLSKVLPRLDEFARTDWLVYGGAQADVLLPLAAQAALYLALLASAALFDLYRKNL